MPTKTDHAESFQSRIQRHPNAKDVPVRPLHSDGPRIADHGLAPSLRSPLRHDSERDTTLTEAFECLLQEAYFNTKKNSYRQVTEDAVVRLSQGAHGVTLSYDPAAFIPGKPFVYVNPEPDNAELAEHYSKANEKSSLAERHVNLADMEAVYGLLGDEFKKRGIEFSINHETHALVLHHADEHDLQYQLQDMYHALHSVRLRDMNHSARIEHERSNPSAASKKSFLDF